MAGCSDDIVGGEFTNDGFIDDRSSVDSSHIPPAPNEELGVPYTRLPGHHSPSAGLEVMGDCTADGPPQLGSKESSSDGRHASPDDEDESLPGPCGYCCWVPSCLQRVASGRFFVLFLSLLSLTEAGLTVGYISSMVTSFELQFRFSSKLTGFVVSCYDIGTLVVILTSYFGGRAAANRPKWIAWSAWSMALGSSIVTLPHFLKRYKASGINDTVAGLCHPNVSSSPYSTDNADWEELACARSDDNIEASALFLLIPGMLLIGAGSTATLTLGTTYIDDFVRKKESPVLLAILFSTTVIGPALGFLIGSYFLRYYVDFDFGSRPPRDSPHWVGAWWLGFFFFAGAILVVAVPVYAFPAKLRKPAKKCKENGMKEADEDSEDGEDGVRMAFSDVSLKKIPLAVWRLLKNPVYMMINVAAAAEFGIITGFVRFAPKFVQSQFQLEAFKANLVTGTLIPVGALGVILGGFILNRVKTSMMSTVTVLSVCTIISGLCYGLIFIPGPCQNMLLAGVTTPYRQNDPSWHRHTDSANLTSDCNAPCHCDVSSYSPVCGDVAGVTYFSPCFAGCRDKIKRNATKGSSEDFFAYYNCTCIEDYNATGPIINVASGDVRTFDFLGETERPLSLRGTAHRYRANSDEAAEAETNMCPSSCGKLGLFLALLLLVVFTSSIGQMPALMALMRCVKKEERPFALGLQFVILRLVGFIPSPIYYGAVIDSTCILWQKGCEGEDGACLLYDNSGFYYRYLGLSTLLKSISVVMAVLVWVVVRRMHTRGATPTPLPSPPPDSDDSGLGTNVSVESRRNDRLSNDISAQSRRRYTEEAQQVPGTSIEHGKQ